MVAAVPMVMQVPGPLGAHNWQPMAFNPKTGLVYIPLNVTPFAYADDKGQGYKPGAWNVGVDFVINSLPTDQFRASLSRPRLRMPSCGVRR